MSSEMGATPWASTQYDTWEVTLTVQTKRAERLSAGGVKTMVSGGIEWAAENYEPGFSWLATGIKVTPAGHYHDARGHEDTPCQCPSPGTYAPQWPQQ